MKQRQDLEFSHDSLLKTWKSRVGMQLIKTHPLRIRRQDWVCKNGERFWRVGVGILCCFWNGTKETVVEAIVGRKNGKMVPHTFRSQSFWRSQIQPDFLVSIGGSWLVLKQYYFAYCDYTNLSIPIIIPEIISTLIAWTYWCWLVRL